VTEAVFPTWTNEHAELWGRVPLKVEHSLHRSPLFSMEALGELIDAYPRDKYSLIHMGAQGGKRFWKEGDKGSMKGADVIEWIRQGRMWINLRNTKDVDPRYGEVLKSVYAEIAMRVPGAPMFNQSMGILISSPNAQVYYHCDLPGQALWQIHGRKRIYVYPNAEPFVSGRDLENIALYEIEEDLRYEPWFDRHATVFDLGPGEMAHWPLNAPHRVENMDVLNVSMTSEHWTDEIVRRQKINVANGLLRHRFGMDVTSRAIRGPAYQAKAVFQGVMRRSGWVKQQRAARRQVEFTLDPVRPGAVAEVAPRAA
jgi:hypothetical protein